MECPTQLVKYTERGTAGGQARGFFGKVRSSWEMWPWRKRERKESHPEFQGNCTGYRDQNREVSKIGIRFLTKRGILRVGRKHPVETANETPLLIWGFFRSESYSYSIFKGLKFCQDPLCTIERPILLSSRLPDLRKGPCPRVSIHAPTSQPSQFS